MIINAPNKNLFSHKKRQKTIVYVDTGTYKTLIETTSKNQMNAYPNGVKGYYMDVK